MSTAPPRKRTIPARANASSSSSRVPGTARAETAEGDERADLVEVGGFEGQPSVLQKLGQRRRDGRDRPRHGRMGAMPGVSATLDVRGDVTDHPALQGRRVGEAAALEGAVRAVDVDAVGGAGDGALDELRETLPIVRSDVVQPSQEGARLHRQTLRMRDRELAIGGLGELPRDQRPHIRGEVQGTIAFDRSGEVAWQRPQVVCRLVSKLGAVRYAPPGARKDDGFVPGGRVAQAPVVVSGEHAAPPGCQQRHQVDEGQPEPPREHRLRGLKRVEADVGGGGGGHVGQAVERGAVGELALDSAGMGVGIPLGRDHHVRIEDTRGVTEQDALPTVGKVAQAAGPNAVIVDLDERGPAFDRPPEGPGQVVAHHDAGRV